MKKTIAAIIMLALCSVAYADYTIKEFSGNGQQATRPFNASSAWEIQWEATGDLFSVAVYTASGEFVGIYANQAGPGKGSSYQPKSGSYYLSINAIGNWKIKVVKVN